MSKREDDRPSLYGTKVCPECGQTLFEDMDVCFECLHEFAPGETADEGWDGGEVPTEVYSQGMPWDERDLQPHGQALSIRLVTGDAEVTVPLPAQGLMVGRDPSCDVVLHARSVSRHHVRIEPCGGNARICDQGATNPATLRGKPMREVADMSPGDVVGICGATLTLVGT